MLPLSDAETVLMPELYPATVPLAIAEALSRCAWCNLRLDAISLAPRQIESGGLYYHPGGCISAARGARRGERTETSGILVETEGAVEVAKPRKRRKRKRR